MPSLDDETGIETRLTLDEAIAHVAKHHDILLRRDDPALIVHTLNALFLEHAQTQLEQSVRKQAELAKSQTASLITASAEYLDEQLRSSVNRIASGLEQGGACADSLLPGAGRPVKYLEIDRTVAWAAAISCLAAALAGIIAVTLPLAIGACS